MCLGTLEHGYGIWLPVSSSQMGVGTPFPSWSSCFFAWSGRHRHVQLGLGCTGLVVPCVVRWLLKDGSEREPQRWRVPATGLDVGAFHRS
jgi:hypothetical protein